MALGQGRSSAPAVKGLSPRDPDTTAASARWMPPYGQLTYLNGQLAGEHLHYATITYMYYLGSAHTH